MKKKKKMRSKMMMMMRIDCFVLISLLDPHLNAAVAAVVARLMSCRTC